MIKQAEEVFLSTVIFELKEEVQLFGISIWFYVNVFLVAVRDLFLPRGGLNLILYCAHTLWQQATHTYADASIYSWPRLSFISLYPSNKNILVSKKPFDINETHVPQPRCILLIHSSRSSRKVIELWMDVIMICCQSLGPDQTDEGVRMPSQLLLAMNGSWLSD